MNAQTDYQAKAQALGSETASAEIENGSRYPIGSPLSGEWAGDLTPRELVFKVYGEHIAEHLVTDVTDELCDAFEEGYQGEWQSELDARLQDSGGECEWL